jgi:chromosome segregation ATPase
MTNTLRYWIEQSEHECDKPLPIGLCFACDMLQLGRELATITEQRDEAKKTVESLTTTAFDLLASLEKARDERDRLAEGLRHAVQRIQDFEEYVAGIRPAPPSTSAAIEFAEDALQSLTNNEP